MPTPTPVSTSSSNASSNCEKGTSSERPYAWQVAHNLGASFRYAGQGIYYALSTQRNFRIHVGASVAVISAGFALQLPSIHIAVIGLTCGAVMALELINTALEAVVDLTVQQTYHELAKIAKDCAAGAVLIAALIAILVGGCLILPPLAAVLRPFLLA
ncbi:MAG: diacylglycerol kinase family protein [Leptolyngbya sp. SIO1E4]|nr:diacylglycerol kinase family protein [Leptolyngbya sp. SIO1E4]